MGTTERQRLCGGEAGWVGSAASNAAGAEAAWRTICPLPYQRSSLGPWGAGTLVKSQDAICGFCRLPFHENIKTFVFQKNFKTINLSKRMKENLLKSNSSGLGQTVARSLRFRPGLPRACRYISRKQEVGKPGRVTGSTPNTGIVSNGLT